MRVARTMTPEEEARWAQEVRKPLGEPIYAPKSRVCPECDKAFTWTYVQQRQFSRNTRQGLDPERPVCCSDTCTQRARRKREKRKGATAVEQAVTPRQ